jgi:hypothetical protein
LTFRPRRFSRPRRFPPPAASWACLIPLPRPGFRFRGFLPPARVRRLVAGASAPHRWHRAPATACALAPSPDASVSRVCPDQ